ncbi:MAG: CD225/dispanin family protein [Planctomycetota bacterium]|nr:CD225/dispanin family protein [Planctomycetota bacterium]
MFERAAPINPGSRNATHEPPAVFPDTIDYAGRGSGAPVKTYLAYSFIAFVVCPLPGLAAVVYSIMAGRRIRWGDRTAAQRYAENAATWGIIAIPLGFPWLVFLAAVCYFFD